MATFKITVVYLVDGVDRPTVLTEQLAKISTDDGTVQISPINSVRNRVRSDRRE